MRTDGLMPNGYHANEVTGLAEIKSSKQKKQFKIPDFLKSRPAVGVTCLLVGAVLGAGIMNFFQTYNPPDVHEVAPSTVFDRIVKQNELVTVSQKYAIVEKTKDTNTLFGFITIPFTENSFWYRYEGMLKAGVNLENAIFELDDSTITVVLDEPYVVSNTPDMERSGVLEERNNVLNPIHIEDIDMFQRQCVAQSEEDAVEAGLLNEAKINAEEGIRNMFAAALGNAYTVEFVWGPNARDDPASGVSATGAEQGDDSVDQNSGGREEDA